MDPGTYSAKNLHGLKIDRSRQSGARILTHNYRLSKAPLMTVPHRRDKLRLIQRSSHGIEYVQIPYNLLRGLLVSVHSFILQLHLYERYEAYVLSQYRFTETVYFGRDEESRKLLPHTLGISRPYAMPDVPQRSNRCTQ